MSKGQKRSNREPKKPKKTKQKTVSGAPSSTAQAKPDPLERGKKKW
jgi:hypothetical protein